MRKTVTRDIYKQTKNLLDPGFSVEKVAKVMKLSVTTVRRIKASRSYKGYVRANRARYTPVNKYDDLMTTYIETPQLSWWDRFRRKK